jgi:hypothetical protein
MVCAWFSSFILNIKEKGRRVANDNCVNQCSIEVLSIGDNVRADGGRMCDRCAHMVAQMVGARCVIDARGMGGHMVHGIRWR